MLNNFLFFLLKHTESKFFYPLHHLVAFIYRKLIAPLLRLYFTLRHKYIKDLFCRHSVLMNDFNCFASDLDYTIIIDDDTNQNDIDRIVFDAQSLIKFFTFLDFPQIYRYREYKLQMQLKRIYPSYYQIVDLFMNLRKLPWLKEKYNSSKNSYHRLKAYRSLKKHFIRLGIEQDVDIYFEENKIDISSLEPLIEKMNNIQNDLYDMDIQNNLSLYSYHLNLDYFIDLKGDNKIKMKIAALTPEHFFNNSSNKPLYQKLFS